MTTYEPSKTLGEILISEHQAGRHRQAAPLILCELCTPGDSLDQDQAEGQRIADALLIMDLPDAQRAGETLRAYRYRLLTWALRGGSPARLDQEERRQLDCGAMEATISLPATLDRWHHGTDQQLHALRLQLAAIERQKAAQAAQLAAWLALPAADDPAPSDQAETPEEDDQARAIRLMRAALTLIMQPGEPDGGTRIRLQRPRPTQPPGGVAIATPTATATITAPRPPAQVPGDDIQF